MSYIYEAPILEHQEWVFHIYIYDISRLRVKGSLGLHKKPVSIIITSHRKKFQSTVCDNKLIIMTVFLPYLSKLNAKMHHDNKVSRG